MAQVCTGGLIVNCPAAVSPQPGDFAWGWQNGQTPHTRKLTARQLLTGALQSTVIGKITAQTATTAGAGLNLGVGATPATCIPGDVWETGGGLFSCPNGQPQGPYGTGGNSLPVFATPATLPAVTAASNGQLGFVQSCPNGAEVGAGATGCIYVVNKVGTWTALPNPTSNPITVGGQALLPGGITTNQGNGSKIQLASGTTTVGHAPAYDNFGNLIDSGVPPGGGSGGGGTVTGSPQNAVPFYSSSGTSTVVSGMTIVNNAVVATNGSGVPAEVTTLPTGLTIPGSTLSSPTLTGTISIAAASYTGKQTYAAGTTGSASLNLPNGVAPTSPVNGDIWATTAGLFSRESGSTQGPYLFNVSTTTPLAGGGAGPTLTITCATCATTTNGGALTATAPLSISAGGLLSLGSQPMPIVWLADSATVVHNDTYFVIEKWPFANSGVINSVVYHTAGTSSPSFVASLQIAGTAVTGCNSLSVTSTTDTTATCTAANTITNGQSLGLIISGATGSPSSALIQINASKPAS